VTSLLPYSRFSRTEPLLSLPSSSSIVLMRLSDLSPKYHKFKYLCFSLWYLCYLPVDSHLQHRAVAVFPFNFSPTWFSWTFLMAYPKPKLKSSSNKASPCCRPFWIRKLSVKCLPIWSLLHVSFQRILIGLTSFLGTKSCMRIFYNNSSLTKS
jgi:hypothetical protein